MGPVLSGNGRCPPGLRALTPTEKCAPELHRKQNKAGVRGSTDNPGIETLPLLVQECLWPWSHVEALDPSSRCCGELVPTQASPLPSPLHALDSRESGNMERPDRSRSSSFSDRSKGPWRDHSLGCSSSPAPAGTCYGMLYPSFPLWASGAPGYNTAQGRCPQGPCVLRHALDL